MECPKCGASHIKVKTKYLQPIQVPHYAQFQPMEKLSLCLVCGFYGKHPLEMFAKEIPIQGLFNDNI